MYVPWVETLIKGEKRTENGNIKDVNEQVQQGTQERELDEVRAMHHYMSKSNIN